MGPRKDTVTAGNRAPMDGQAAGDIAAFIKGEPFRGLNRSGSFATRRGARSSADKKPAADGETAGGRSMCF